MIPLLQWLLDALQLLSLLLLLLLPLLLLPGGEVASSPLESRFQC